MTVADNDESRFEAETSGSSKAKRGPASRRRRKIIVTAGFGALSLIVLAILAAGLLGHQASVVRKELTHAVSLAPQLRTAIANEDPREAERVVSLVRENTSTARSIVAGPLWTAASALPVLGENFHAIAEAAVSADDVTSHALDPLVKAYGSLDSQALAPQDGEVDIHQIENMAPNISIAESTIRLSHERMEAIDLSHVIPQVADPIRSGTEQLREARDVLATASSAAKLIPPLLGSEENRNTLVLIQNNAESRASGGIPGALAVLNTHEGRVVLSSQDSASNLGAFAPPVRVDAEQELLYTQRLGTQMQNVNLTPDFPTAAATAKQMWEERHVGQNIDAVVSLDPVALSHLLGAIGSVELTDAAVLSSIEGTSLPVTLTEENVVSTLLSDVYRDIEEPDAQDAYYAAVASRIFAAFSDGQGDSAALLEALATSVREHRVNLWSSHTDEQNIVATTGIAGSVTGPPSGGASFGAYFNDGTGAKMDYHMKRTVQLLQICKSNGYRTYTIRMTATNTAPLDARSSLPKYVTGDGAFGVAPGRVRTNYVVYGPAQSLAETATLNGEAVPLGSGKHGQRPVAMLTNEIGPGESAVMDIIFTGVVQESTPQLLTTPTVQDPRDVILPMQEDPSCE